MKKMLAAVLAALALSGAAGAVEVSAPSAVLMEKETGTVLYAKDEHAKLEPASVTKVMTLLLACEAIDQGRMTLDDPVTASTHAASMGGSQIWLEEGEVLTVGEMLKCVAVVSANDCAVALGEHLAGSEESFVAMMNARAKELGMENTHFVNACGLTAEGHLTSAYDIGLMSAKLMGEHLAGSEEAFVAMMNRRAQELGMKNTQFVNACGLTEEGHFTSAYDIGLMSGQLLREHPWISEYVTIWQDSIRQGQSVLNNTNKLLKSYQGITGLKTGYTSTAGYCISATAQREGLPLIAVIMGAGSSADRNADAAALLNWGFANFAAVTLGADRPLLPLPVEMGRQDTVMPELGEGEVQVLPREGLNRLEKTLELPESLQAPVEKGQQIGQLVVTLDGKEVCRVPVLAAEGVERLGLWDVFRNFFECFFKV